MSGSFSSTLPVIVFTRPRQSEEDWREVDRGPGIFHLSPDEEAGIRIRSIDDEMLETLVREMSSCEQVVSLNLSENRKITDQGVAHLKQLKYLVDLNLSSCGITNTGLEHVAVLSRLVRLNLSYCNRITDQGIRLLKPLANLRYLDLQGCIKVTHSGLVKIRRMGLTIHK